MSEECFRWACEAQTDEVRLCYINLAQTWLQAALWLENVPPRGSPTRPPPKRKIAA